MDGTKRTYADDEVIRECAKARICLLLRMLHSISSSLPQWVSGSLRLLKHLECVE